MRLFVFALTTSVIFAAEAEYPLPDLAKSGSGVLRVDLNADGHADIVVSNDKGYGVYLFVPPEQEKKNLEWLAGWTQVLREGSPGDANALPLLTSAAVEVWDGSLHVDGQQLSFSELLRVPGPAPLTPQQALQTLQVPKGLTVTLVAAEPIVQDPVFIDWDEQQRLWVVEMGDYPFSEGESTKDGSVTWKDGIAAEGDTAALRMGRVRVLEDQDHDGVYERSTIFLDHLKHPTGLAFWKGGVFISAIPDILYARDTNGDLVCDEKEPWISGFTAGNPQHLVNGFCMGLDGWLHGANGDSGGELTILKTGETVKLGINDFRFHPETGQFKLETGRTQCGKWRDDFGNWFGNNNSNPAWHYWLPMRYLEQHPDLTPRSVRLDVTDERAIRPAGPPQRRLNQQSTVNRLTSGCNAMPFTGLGLPPSMLICEPANHLVQRLKLDYSTPAITASAYAEDVEAGRDFLTSTDAWFRPVMARIGPDGALYVADMYRLVLEHPEWIPAQMAKNMQLRGGQTMGRIYRIGRVGDTVPSHIPLELGSANRWVRDTAQRRMLERKSADDQTMLRTLAEVADPAVRTQVVFTMHALGLIDLVSMRRYLEPLWPWVRSAALVAADADELTAQEKELLEQVSKASSAKVVVTPIIEKHDPDRQKVVQRYLEAAKLRGDAVRGQTLYLSAGCVACHKLGKLGVEVGPDLGTIANKPPEQLIESIFDPNRAVEQRNLAVQLTLKSGESVTGLVAAELPGSLTMRMPGGMERVVRRDVITEQKTLETSLMPAGLETLLPKAQDCADLLAAIKRAGGEIATPQK